MYTFCELFSLQVFVVRSWTMEPSAISNPCIIELHNRSRDTDYGIVLFSMCSEFLCKYSIKSNNY